VEVGGVVVNMGVNWVNWVNMGVNWVNWVNMGVNWVNMGVNWSKN
jgi:hypothetical protein